MKRPRSNFWEETWADVEGVPCRYCGAAADEPCHRKSDRQPLGHFPAHIVRIADAERIN